MMFYHDRGKELIASMKGLLKVYWTSVIGRSSKFLFLVSLFFLHVSCISTVDEDERVYITNTGTRYHTDDCIYLGRSKTPIALSDAISKGFYPCQRCLNSEMYGQREYGDQDSSDRDTVIKKRSKVTAQKKSNSVQCHGITKKGLRCKRRTTNSNGYCYQHQGQE